MAGIIRQFIRNNRCVAVIEFALVVPTFAVVLAGMTDIGNAWYTWSQLEQAVGAGANYALLQYGKTGVSDATLASNIGTLVSSSNGGTAANTTVVINDGATYTVTNGTGAASGTASTACYCLSGSPGHWNWGSPVTCSTAGSPLTCSGSSQYTPGKFVTITASYGFTATFPFYDFVSASTITASAAVQTQ